VIAQQVLGWRNGPLRVKRVPLIRHRQVEDTAGSEHPDHVPERPQRVLTVLEEVVRDHKVLRPVGDRCQALAIVEHVHVDERSVGQLRVVLPEPFYRQMVHIPNVGRLRDIERVVESADLDPVPAEVAACDLSPVTRHGIDRSAQSAHDVREACHPRAKDRVTLVAGLVQNVVTRLRRSPLLLAGFALRSLSDRLFVAAAVRDLRRRTAGADDLEAALDLVYELRAGDVAIAPMQVSSEIEELLRRVQAERPRTVLEVGTASGGSLFLFTRVAADDATIVSIDLPGGKFGGGYPALRKRLYSAFARPSQRLHLVRADSHDPATRMEVEQTLGGRPIDFLFVDGDHSLEGVRADFDLYLPLVRDGGLVAIHDIVPGSRDLVGGVPDFWREVKEQYGGEEIVADSDQGGYGIGVLRKRG
jgi:predicted O-methyltransferase YrrM